MCLLNQDVPNKARRMTAIGCACLVIALSQRALLPEAVSATTRYWISALTFLLLILSIALNLYALHLRKRSNH